MGLHAEHPAKLPCLPSSARTCRGPPRHDDAAGSNPRSYLKEATFYETLGNEDEPTGRLGR